MADIVERLRLYAQQFEDQHAPDQITLAMRAGADEIERKKDEIASLLNALADERTESMRLRAALRGVIRVADRDTPEFNEARAALEGRT